MNTNTESSLDKYATAGEAKVARALVTAILAKGHSIDLNDGEEWTLEGCKDAAQIEDALATTGYDTIRATDAYGVVYGSFYLVYGNEEDGSELIADCTDNDYCAELSA